MCMYTCVNEFHSGGGIGANRYSTTFVHIFTSQCELPRMQGVGENTWRLATSMKLSKCVYDVPHTMVCNADWISPYGDDALKK